MLEHQSDSEEEEQRLQQEIEEFNRTYGQPHQPVPHPHQHREVYLLDKDVQKAIRFCDRVIQRKQGLRT